MPLPDPAIDELVGPGRLLDEAGAAVLVQGQAAERRGRMHAQHRAQPVVREVEAQAPSPAAATSVVMVAVRRKKDEVIMCFQVVGGVR